MGFAELLLIAVVAVIFLGPEKLPQAMIDVGRFFRKFKSAITDAKGALDEELKLSELKSDAVNYKNKVEGEAKSILDDTGVEKSSREVKDLFSDLTDTSKSEAPDKSAQKSGDDTTPKS
jgi:sec-independent protein translocase protein TatB